MSGVMRKAMVYLGLSDDDYQEFNTIDDRATVAAPRAGADYTRGAQSIRPITPSETPAAPVATLPRPTSSRAHEKKPAEPVHVYVVEPTEFADAQSIGDRLRDGQPVCVSLTDVDADLARRLIDFCSGSAYVLSGSMERVARNVFLLIPSGVEVPSSELQRLRDRGLAYP